MVDDSSGGGESSSLKSRVTPSYARLGDRQVFTVELRPGDTTFVSWKKLMKDANKADFGSAPALDDPPPANAHPNLVSRIAPVQATENEGKDASTSNRFSTVIEKIESLYMGKDSSDEEVLKVVPYDNQYDSEDSFIDDAELDEYFEFDNSEIKHDGFFVNRGKLECINDPTVVSNQQPKKRRRKNLMKVPEDSDYGSALNNRVKLGKSAEANEFEKPNAGDLQAKFLTSKSKNGTICFDAWNQKYNDKNVYAQSKLYSGKPVSNVNELESSVRSKEQNGGCQLPDHKIRDARISTQATTSHVHKRDGSSVRPKGSMLEKAICELEKMVTELRPPALENQEAHASVQAIKRRLPGEIKLKLAKVARLAQASQGKISKELINRLMSILGHVIRLRTLKRNLKIMITMGLSVKQENDDRFQQIKKEVVEIIKTLVPSLETKVFEQQAVAPDDFQEIGHEGKGALKRKFSMDAILEDKICDLYDLFVDGLDDDAAPQVRKLYMELAALWPSGFMDNRGIKRAICRAKERRRAMYNRLKDQEKIKRKKLLASKMQETVRSNVGLVAEPQHMPARLSGNADDPVMALTSKTILNSATTADHVPSPSTDAPNLERPKQEKQKAYGSNSIDEEVKRGTDGSSTKKKAKRRPEPEVGESHIRAEKLHFQHSEGRQEYIKQASEVEPKNLQLNAAASSELSYVTYN